MAALDWPPVQARAPPAAPVPGVIVIVIVAAPVTGLPKASTTRTEGCVGPCRAAGPASRLADEDQGAAAPAVTAKAPLVTPVRPGADAASAYPVPTLFAVQPPYAATPTTAARVSPPVQASAAPGVPVPSAMAIVTVSDAPATALPPASTTRRPAATANGVPAGDRPR